MSRSFMALPPRPSAWYRGRMKIYLAFVAIGVWMLVT